MRKPRPRLSHLSDFVDACLGPSLAAQGFATSDVLLAWPDIVGERLAAFTQPMKIEWKRKSAGAGPEDRPEPATLVVRVESAFALEMQHLAPVVMERVNAHYGWRCVGRIVLKQGPVRRAQPRRRPSATRWWRRSTPTRRRGRACSSTWPRTPSSGARSSTAPSC